MRPSSQFKADSIFYVVCVVGAFSIVALMAALFLQLILNAIPAFQTFGAEFLYSADWDPAQSKFGALPSIRGTLLTTLIAILFAVPSAFFIAFLLSELLPTSIAKVIGHAVDLLAAIPSIIFGMWAFFILIPLMQNYVQPFLQNSIPLTLGDKPAYVANGPDTQIQLNGNAGWLEAQNTYYLDLKDDFTVAFKLEVSENQQASLFKKGSNGIHIQVLQNGALNFNGAITQPNAVKEDTTQQICVELKNKTPYIWVNQIPQTLDTAAFVLPQNNEEPLWIGGHPSAGFFKGNFAWIRYYSNAIPIEKITDRNFVDVSESDREIDENQLEVAWQFNTGEIGKCTDIASSIALYFNAKKIEFNILKDSIFAGTPNGSGVITAGLILAIMILPFMTAVMRDIFEMTPAVIKEASYGIGATVWEVTWHITLPYGMQGFLGAVFLGLGRALGETMAVLFIIGNAPYAGASLFEPSTTIASTLANSFGEADGIFKNVLFALALILLVISFSVQIIAQWWLNRVRKTQGGGL